ncbi:16S rRNA (cytidine(1402)-2'-O)-methyltransferase [Phytoactinopolyspora limicola]|uniref:16S rRNA (cytidine(1402)-2'-O)-methyltransferase n=1 Tax=Phytoactinopolyspora limicola TaxID=2715536 RepID=UPI00140886C6|nr:16S rRNA (cytidine(1402)-2'-O)-methyltransferase [Phytoactinopolyspora limicola]
MPDDETTPGAGRLVLAATPIGQVDDASPRLARELVAADVVAAEDTRRLRRLATSLGVTLPARVVSYFEANEAARTDELVSLLRTGATVVLVTDAGMPAVSDPGYRLVEAAVRSGVLVTSVPGPSAVVTALAVSGLPVARFTFDGFPPRRAGERARWLAELSAERRTMVFFESRHRLAGTLDAMAAAFGVDRPAAVCRELTKVHEQVRRGGLGELAGWAEQEGPLGEITIVVGGAPAPSDDGGGLERGLELVRERVAAGSSRRDAVAEVARELGVSRRELYAAAVDDQR